MDVAKFARDALEMETLIRRVMIADEASVTKDMCPRCKLKGTKTTLDGVPMCKVCGWVFQ